MEKLGFEHYFTGIVRGCESENKSNRDGSKTWVENSLYCEGAKFNTIQFKFTRDAIEKTDIFQRCRALIGQRVRFPVYSINRVYQGRIYTDHYVQGSETPVVLDAPKSEKAVAGVK